MAKEITRAEAWELLREYNQEPFHLQHGQTVEAVMGWYAEKLGYGDEKDFWKLVGLLHDLDYEKWPEQHCEKTREIMEGLDLDPRLIRAIVSHGYGHRNDVSGYARALEDFDRRLPKLLDMLDIDDMLMITADHGCDPATPSTDHSREYVPVLIYGKQIAPLNLGTHAGFAHAAATVAAALGIRRDFGQPSLIEFE